MITSHRLVLALALTLALAGCQKQKETPPPAPAAESTAPAPTAAAEKIVTVRGRVAGDRACYLTVEDGTGKTHDEMASFELCEREDLVGRRARLHFEKGQVQAESCQGNPDCTDSETVDLVTGIDLLP